MTKPPSDMTSIWVRDENGDIRERIKHGARRKGQKVADFLRIVIDDALTDIEAAKSDRKIGQNARCNNDCHSD